MSSQVLTLVVNKLIQCGGFHASVTEFDSLPELTSCKSILNIVQANSNLLQLSEDHEIVSFAPKVEICEAYNSNSQCARSSKCGKLHICIEFIWGLCKDQAKCPYTHSLQSIENREFLSRSLHLPSNVASDTVLAIIRKGLRGTFCPPLCDSYVKLMCPSQSECNLLHLCDKFVFNQDHDINCKLNHNHKTIRNLRVLGSFGFQLDVPESVITAYCQASWKLISARFINKSININSSSIYNIRPSICYHNEKPKDSELADNTLNKTTSLKSIITPSKVKDALESICKLTTRSSTLNETAIAIARKLFPRSKENAILKVRNLLRHPPYDVQIKKFLEVTKAQSVPNQTLHLDMSKPELFLPLPQSDHRTGMAHSTPLKKIGAERSDVFINGGVTRQSSVLIEKVSIYCLCKDTYSGIRDMIFCDKCNIWFHAECIDVNFTDVKDKTLFSCPQCKVNEGGVSTCSVKCTNTEEKGFIPIVPGSPSHISNHQMDCSLICSSSIDPSQISYHDISDPSIMRNKSDVNPDASVDSGKGIFRDSLQEVMDISKQDVPLSGTWTVDVSADEFQKVIKRRSLQKHWTDNITSVVQKNEINECCVLVFKKGYIKKKNSRKRTGFFFRADAVCKFPGCGMKFHFHVEKRPKLKKNVKLHVEVKGEFCHRKGEQYARHTRSPQRKAIGKVLESGVKPSAYRLEKFQELSKKSFSSGNLTHAKNLLVYQKIGSEFQTNKDFHKDDFLDVVLMHLEELGQEEPRLKVCGYVQEISHTPMWVILFSEHQLRLVNYVDGKQCVDLFFDATGSVVRTPAMCPKKVFYYALIIESPAHASPMPIAELLASDHTVPTISHFLDVVCHRFKLVFTKKMPVRKVETDFSFAILQSVVRSFCDTSLKHYISWTWEVVHNRAEVGQTDTIIHVCCAHVMHAFLLAVGIKETGLKTFVHNFMRKMQECNTLESLKEIVECGFTVLLCKVTNKAVERCRRKISKTSITVEDDEDVMTFDNNFDEPSAEHDKATLRAGSPFTKLCDQIKLKVMKLCEIYEEENSSEDYCNEFCDEKTVDILLRDYLPFASLWTGIMLPKELITTVLPSNAPVENHMKITKHDTAGKSTNLKLGRFIRKSKCLNMSRLKSFCLGLGEFYGKSRRKLPKISAIEKDIELAQELWSRRRPKKSLTKRLRQSPRVKKCVPRQSVLRNQDNQQIKATDCRTVDKEHASITGQSVGVSNMDHSLDSNYDPFQHQYSDKVSKPVIASSPGEHDSCILDSSAASSIEDNSEFNLDQQCEQRPKEPLKTSSSVMVDNGISEKGKAEVKLIDLQWGGNGIFNGSPVYLDNTCTIDNGLFLLFTMLSEYKVIFGLALTQAKHNSTMDHVVQCYRALRANNFFEAKMIWITKELHIPVRTNINLWGDDLEYFVEHFKYLCKYERFHSCSVDSCVILSVTSVADANTLSYMHHGKTLPLELMRDKPAGVCPCEKGSATRKYRFLTAPLFSVITFRFPCSRLEDIPLNIRICEVDYVIFGVTFYIPKSKHFVAAFRLHNKWNWYDGLKKPSAFVADCTTINGRNSTSAAWIIRSDIFKN